MEGTKNEKEIWFFKREKNPHAGKFKDGYTIVVEHKDYDEVITVTKEKKLKKESREEATASTSAPAVST